MRASAIVLVGVLFAAATAVTTSAVSSQSTDPAVVTINATADQKFEPDHAVLHVGQRQTLRFTSTGGVHGIASAELGIPSTMITPGKPVSVSVTPRKLGKYKVPCSIVCGPGHADMILTLEVKP